MIIEFRGVDDIGQPFADELFQEFPLNHPEIKISMMRTNKNVKQMIKYVSDSADRD